MKKIILTVISAVLSFSAQAEIFHKPKLIAEYQQYSIEADTVEPAGSFFMVGGGITLYTQTGWYLDSEYITGGDRSELGIAFGKSFGSWALFGGYKSISTAPKVPQYGDNTFDIKNSGIFIGGSWNNKMGEGTLTTSIAFSPSMEYFVEGDFYDDGIVERVEGSDTFTWSGSSAYNFRLEGGRVLSVGVKYAEYSMGDRDEGPFDAVNASSFDERTVSLYSKYAF